MDGSINFSGTLAGSIANDGGDGDVTDVKVRDSQETTFESVVNEQGVAEIDLISYVRRNELTQAIENVENSIDNVEQLMDTKQNIINYSTTEQLTGRTLNGKPTYIKIFEQLNMSPDSAHDIAEGIDDVILHDICVIIDNIKYYPSNISMYDYQGAGSYYVNIRLFTDTHKLQILNQSRNNIVGCRAIIEYTKTGV